MSITLDSPSAQIESPDLAEPRIPLTGITWEQYETMIAMVGDRPRLRLSYLDGTLEIMTISPEHEMIKKMIARLLEVYALEVWVWQAGTMIVQRLRSDGSGYDAFASSALLPQLDLGMLAEYIRPKDEPQALRAFRNLIREQIPT